MSPKLSNITDDIQKYIACMEDVKRRLEVIGSFLAKTKTTGYLITDAEFLCLQFRKVLELIALSSLAAHHHEYESIHANFSSHWNAKRIIEAIEKINQAFYPVPGIQVRDIKTGKVEKVKPKLDGYLTKEDFIQVFDTCCKMLHTENIYNKKHQNIDTLFSQFPEWHRKVIELLNHHQVQLMNPDLQLWVIMQEESDGKVHVAEMLRVSELQRENNEE